MGQFRILNRKGDEPLTWDPKNPEEVAQARAFFAEKVKEGSKIYKVDKTPRRTGDPVTEFDPEVGEYLVAPPMGGGC